MYINDTTQIQITYQQIKADNSDVSIPINTSPVIMNIYYYINPTAQQAYDEQFEKLVEGAPIKTGEVYNQVWDLVFLTQPEIDARVDNATVVRKSEVKTEVITQIDSFYQSEDLTQARVRDQITSKYNTYSRIPTPTQDQIDYMTETDEVTDYTTAIYDDLVQANIELDAMTTEQEVLDYVFVMPPLPTVTSYILMALIGSMTE